MKAEDVPPNGELSGIAAAVSRLPGAVPAGGPVALRLLDTRTRMWLVLAGEQAQFPHDNGEAVPVWAQSAGAGNGWLVCHRIDPALTYVEESVADKAKAKARLRALAKVLAKGLQVELGPDMKG